MLEVTLSCASSQWEDKGGIMFSGICGLDQQFGEINRLTDLVLGGAIPKGPKMSLFGLDNLLEL